MRATAEAESFAFITMPPSVSCRARRPPDGRATLETASALVVVAADTRVVTVGAVLTVAKTNAPSGAFGSESKSSDLRKPNSAAVGRKGFALAGANEGSPATRVAATAGPCLDAATVVLPEETFGEDANSSFRLTAGAGAAAGALGAPNGNADDATGASPAIDPNVGAVELRAESDGSEAGAFMGSVETPKPVNAAGAGAGNPKPPNKAGPATLVTGALAAASCLPKPLKVNEDESPPNAFAPAGVNEGSPATLAVDAAGI